MITVHNATVFVPAKDDSESQMELIQRIKHEKKFGEHQQHEAIKINFITTLFDIISEMSVEEDDESERTLGEELAYNTMFHYGFLKKIN